ncbi:helix-hairpin-helix domain-containing protein [Flavilitoribacter nigricans]|uniref:Pathogenicity locus n=1 Tax=Flavilitoribacter nigricans (strain ATCC 23147 / DSM 23189 / NBRC 102662 / NCIMB 1420 / SS-2) TaxID=1122177 RepID=A0A2D0N1U3_FLAN2|nr:helix-hairpin-helix domain-containing protein [Flavilitoribacter nigricans]PHN02501.1 Pathogenicity locus [Flavilitoribacter nigricans DSM 23189 = NBRC 102662]
MKKKNIKLQLTDEEKKKLRTRKCRISDLWEMSAPEIETLLQVSSDRARELRAFIEFQTVPSIGIRFAEDLIFLGYYSLDELKSKDGARLVEDYERKKGYWIDPCVEDQFRLVVYAAGHSDCQKQWWDFTEARKQYRAEQGYPADRPLTPWYEVIEIKSKKNIAGRT